VYFVVIEAQVEGVAIPEAVGIEGVVPKANVLGEAAFSPEVPIAPEITEEVHNDALLEIQDAEPICSALISETAMTSRGGLEPLADDLIDPAMVARNLESMRRAEQWMKVHDSTFR
jgi:hypothetical protein